jgi:hypothetical protein
VSCTRSRGRMLRTESTDSLDSSVPQRHGTPGPPQQQNPQAPPVELAAASPMQGHPAVRTFSWATGGDGTDRSSNPA